MPDVVVHACDPSYQESEAGEWLETRSWKPTQFYIISEIKDTDNFCDTDGVQRRRNLILVSTGDSQMLSYTKNMS
jgi:hypothetical protein